jgi:signal peptidase I
MSKLALEPLFENNNKIQIWITSDFKKTANNLLVTVSDVDGERSAFVGRGQTLPTKAKHFVQTPPERVVTATQLRNRKIKKIFTNLGYLLAVVLLSFSALSFAGVIKARVVLTGSMVPTINPGDIVITASPYRDTPHIGSIVAYTARTFAGAPVGIFTHRIIGGNLQTGFKVKGDHNPLPDVQSPKIKDIDGVVLFKIPWLGKIANPRALFVVIPTVVGIWMVADALKEKDEDEVE